MKFCILIALLVLIISGCEEAVEETVFQTVKVSRRDIIVSVEAAGIVEPPVTVEVKSKASGEILELLADTGDLVEKGTLLVKIDKRAPRNLLAQAEAELEAARARRSIARAQSDRAKTLFESRTLNEVDYEQTMLEFANAKADVVRAEVAVENARIELEDTHVRAPSTGTIIEKLVESGQVISSPTRDVGGGTLILKMADLRTVQVKTLVDETDIGKIRPGLAATVTVTAYPNQPFQGQVLKIEPQALAEQTVTTFSVLIRLDNQDGLLRPGMNAEVEIRVAERLNVLAVPTIALKVPLDIPVAARLVGLDETTVRRQLGSNGGAGSASPGDSRSRGPAGGSGRPAASSGRPPPAAGNARRRPDPARRTGVAYQFAGQYWVFTVRNDEPVAVRVKTGLTDLDYSEILEGLADADEVMLLPSSGLIRAQERTRDRMRRFTGVPGISGSGSNR
jgi:HlyD family secretion protein